MTLVHGFYPLSSAERAHTDVAVCPVVGPKGSYRKSADVGGMQSDLMRLLASVLRVPEDVARGGELVRDGQGGGRRLGGVGCVIAGLRGATTIRVGAGSSGGGARG